MKQQQHRWGWVPVTWVALRWGDRSCPHRDGRANVGLAPAPRAGLSWWPQAPCAGAASPFPPQRALPASLGGGQHLLSACQETGRWGWDGAPPLYLAGSHEMSLGSHTPSSRKVKRVWGKKERHPQKRQNLSVLTQRQGGDVKCWCRASSRLGVAEERGRKGRRGGAHWERLREVLTSTGIFWAWVVWSDTRNWKYLLKLFCFLIRKLQNAICWKSLPGVLAILIIHSHEKKVNSCVCLCVIANTGFCYNKCRVMWDSPDRQVIY